MKHPLPARPEHIGVLRLSALGDVCNLVPTVRALQRQWPEARITWIIGKGEHSLLAGLSGVEFIVYDKSSGLSGMRELWRRLADTRFDVLLHMQQALRASVLSLGLKADLRIGYDKHVPRMPSTGLPIASLRLTRAPMSWSPFSTSPA